MRRKSFGEAVAVALAACTTRGERLQGALALMYDSGLRLAEGQQDIIGRSGGRVAAISQLYSRSPEDVHSGTGDEEGLRENPPVYRDLLDDPQFRGSALHHVSLLSPIVLCFSCV